MPGPAVLIPVAGALISAAINFVFDVGKKAVGAAFYAAAVYFGMRYFWRWLVPLFVSVLEPLLNIVADAIPQEWSTQAVAIWSTLQEWLSLTNTFFPVDLAAELWGLYWLFVLVVVTWKFLLKLLPAKT